MSLAPGIQFYAEVISCLGPAMPTLRRTPSTYSFGDTLEMAPRPNDLYVVCQDGSVQSVWEPDRPIGWEIFETENGWSYRVTQVGFEPRPCLVRYHSRAEEIRPGGHGVGNSRFAAIYEDGEEGPLRVWAPGVGPPGPGLAVSRSLGDTRGKLAGVSAAPDIYTATLAPGEDAFLIVASDGLWEFVSGAAVA